MDEQRRLLLGRRGFLRRAAGVAAYAGALPGLMSPLLAGRTPDNRVVGQEPWGTLSQIADGVWALVSAPLEDRKTLCNGGLIAGSQGVLVVEGFGTTDGAGWMAERAAELAGHRPTHVVITHYHGDHVNGVAGYFSGEDGPRIHLTRATRDRVLETDRARTSGPDPDRARLLSRADLLDPDTETKIDLGGRTVRVVPRAGHTTSDVTVEVQEADVVFCGDLVWNTMFPNYVDAIPSSLSRSVRSLIREGSTVYVPGHGTLADGEAMARFVRLIDTVEEAARKAFERGVPAEEAAKSFKLPDALGEWFLFSDTYYARALGAWERELRSK